MINQVQGRAEQKDGEGNGTLGLTEKNAPWHRRCANRSPRYTTNWDELMKVYTDEGAADKARLNTAGLK
ncbi:DUF4113 domain-containing protein [Vreelandella titanicae]|uniref:DUF4113 domain-containing protein n=1 Tax=Vreelandella titanicae TaxID=664683 RepID=UPI001680F799|nr:DUF4113 domain-containing protein [Halomonas titanicae]